jgi:hypothetical protein
MDETHLLKEEVKEGRCETTFCPFTPCSMKQLYLKVHVLPLKEKIASVFLNIRLRS